MSRSGKLRGLTGIALAALLVGTAARAQAPPIPDPAVPPALGEETPTDRPTATATPREVELEDRVRQLEAMVNRLSNQVEILAAPKPAAAAPAAATKAAPKKPSGPLAPGQGTPINPAPSDRFSMPAPARNAPLTAKFGPGFELKSEDEEFVLQFHDLTQVDGRFYEQGGQKPVTDTFAFPRQWLMFSGRLTKPYEYFVSLQVPFENAQLLDAFLNVHYNDKLQFKFGRFKTPFTYEFYQLPIQGLIQPERSLFFNNFALNRQTGFMGWGQLFDKRLDYAAGIFNTNRNGLFDTSDGKNFLAYLNYRPFLANEGSPFQFLAFGGSVDTGEQVSDPQPRVLRTLVPTVGNAIFGVPFLTFNDNIRESGVHALWTAHAALYHDHLSIVAELGTGYQNYAPVNALRDRTPVDIESYYVQAGYFITGETVSGRGVVKPLRPFDVRPGQEGPGAVELVARYNSLALSDDVFTRNLANPDLWADSLYTTDLGFNWYLNEYVKVLFTWEHAVFGDPVLFNASTGSKQLTSDLFLIRCQIFF